MDLMLFYSFITAIAVYLGVAVLGALVLPLFFAPERLIRFMSGMTEGELNIRDKILFPLTRVFVRLGVHPNIITISGVVLVVWLMVAFLREDSPVIIFVLTIAAGFTDMIDGPVARAAGRVTVVGGMLDIMRDIMLIVVVSGGVIIYGLVDLRMLVWFFGGEAVIFFLKVWESARLHESGRVLGGFIWRFAGEGKPIIDRVKFFFFIIAIAVSVAGPYFQFNLMLVAAIFFICSILAIIFSIMIQASLLRGISK